MPCTGASRAKRSCASSERAKPCARACRALQPGAREQTGIDEEVQAESRTPWSRHDRSANRRDAWTFAGAGVPAPDAAQAVMNAGAARDGAEQLRGSLRHEPNIKCVVLRYAATAMPGIGPASDACANALFDDVWHNGTDSLDDPTIEAVFRPTRTHARRSTRGFHARGCPGAVQARRLRSRLMLVVRTCGPSTQQWQMLMPAGAGGPQQQGTGAPSAACDAAVSRCQEHHADQDDEGGRTITSTMNPIDVKLAALNAPKVEATPTAWNRTARRPARSSPVAATRTAAK
jgi:hypothetical protein